jgi:hypothetical protein
MSTRPSRIRRLLDAVAGAPRIAAQTGHTFRLQERPRRVTNGYPDAANRPWVRRGNAAARRMEVSMTATAGVFSATCIATVLAAVVLPAAAQAQRSTSPMQQGAGALMYGSCRSDVLSQSQRAAVAALAALSPGVARAMVQAYDPTDEVALYCSKDLHDKRCTTKIVAVLGSALTAQPGGQVMPPSQNPGAVVGATAGAVVGLLGGATMDRPLLGAALGGWAGAKAGSTLVDGGAAASCIHVRNQLDAASAKLVGTLGPVGSLEAEDVRLLIASNLHQRRITQAESDALLQEVARLSGKVDALMQAMR